MGGCWVRRTVSDVRTSVDKAKDTTLTKIIVARIIRTIFEDVLRDLLFSVEYLFMIVVVMCAFICAPEVRRFSTFSYVYSSSSSSSSLFACCGVLLLGRASGLDEGNKKALGTA